MMSSVEDVHRQSATLEGSPAEVFVMSTGHVQMGQPLESVPAMRPVRGVGEVRAGGEEPNECL